MRRIYILFLLSGAAGLIYQVVWSGLLGHVFGVTVHAVTATLATFLGGLALGGLSLGRLADRARRPLALYGWLEIGVAITALTSLAALRGFDPVHIWFASRLAGSWQLALVRVILTGLVILPPTFFMGGTLPVITRAVVPRIQKLGREISLLYALNALGAVIGTMLAGFVLVRAVGLRATLLIAVATNLVVGLAALWLAARSADLVSAGRDSGASRSESPTVTVPSRSATGLLVVAFATGVVTLGLEVLWTRALVMSIGTTTYAFTTMLTAFLVGMSFGGGLARAVVDRVDDPRRTIGWLQLGVAAATLLTLPILDSGLLQQWLGGLGSHWARLLLVRFGVSLLVMLVPATLIGMTFPLMSKLAARELDTLGGRIGQLYGVNTMGNILGAVAAGFLLLPTLGLQKGLSALALVALINSVWGLAPSSAGRSDRFVRARLAVVGGILIVIVALLAAWQPRPFHAWGERPEDRTLFYEEGVVATVKVVQDARDETRRWMAVDAIRIGESHGGVDAKQQTLAHFPFLLRTTPPERILSIGLGTGIVIGEAARHEAVRAVDCIEISPAVIEAAYLFEEFNHGAMNDPRIRVINDDGVNFLRRIDTRYDAIISDAKSRTTHAANSTFFSSDYYRLSREHLAPGGIMIQWIPLNVPSSELRTVLRTFDSVFPHMYVWISPPHSAYLVGVEEPLTVDVAHVSRLLASPAMARLREYGLRDARAFLGLLTADGESLARWLGLESTVNSLDHPVLEFYSLREHAEPLNDRGDANLIGLHPRGGDPWDSVTLVGEVPGWQQSQRSVRSLGQGLTCLEGSRSAEVSRCLDPIREATMMDPAHPVIGQTAAAAYRAVLDIDPGSFRAHIDLGRLSLTQGLLLDGIRHYRKATELRPDDPSARLRLGIALKTAGEVDGALEQLRVGLKLEPDGPMTLNGVASILATHPDRASRRPEEAVRLARRAAELTQYRNPVVLDTLASAYASAGRLDLATSTAQSALRLAVSFGAEPLAAAIRGRLRSYSENQPDPGAR